MQFVYSGVRVILEEVEALDLQHTPVEVAPKTLGSGDLGSIKAGAPGKSLMVGARILLRFVEEETQGRPGGTEVVQLRFLGEHEGFEQLK